MEPTPYALSLEELVASARVPVEEQVPSEPTGVQPELLPDPWPQLRWPN